MCPPRPGEFSQTFLPSLHSKSICGGSHLCHISFPPPSFPKMGPNIQKDYLSQQASSRESVVTTTHLPRFLVFQSPKPGARRSGDLPHWASEFREGTASTLVSELLSPCSHVTALDHREIDREPEQTNKKTSGNDT